MRRSLAPLLALALAASASADDGALERLAATKLEAVAASYRTMARWCRSHGLRRAGWQYYAEVIALFPDDSAAREALGYQKQGGQWVLARPANKRNDPKAEESKAAAELDRMRETHAGRASAAYRELAASEAAKARPEVRRQYQNRVLAFDPADAGARAALGWRAAGEHWVLAAAADALDAASAGEPVTDVPAYATSLGVALAQRRTAHLLVATAAPDALCERLARTGEGSHALLHTWLALPNVLGDQRLAYTFLPSQEKYLECIERFDRAGAAHQELGRAGSYIDIASLGIVASYFPRPEEDFQLDRIAYLVTGELAFQACRGKRCAWLQEGLAWAMCLRGLGTRYHQSVTLADGSTSDQGDKRWSDHTRWRAFLRELVLLGEAPHVSTILNAESINDIRDEQAAVAWSLVDYFLDTAPAQLGVYCTQLAQDRGTGEALELATDLEVEQLDARWRAYVLANY